MFHFVRDSLFDLYSGLELRQVAVNRTNAGDKICLKKVNFKKWVY